MGKEIVTQVQETQRNPARINPRGNMPRHIVIELTTIKDKEKILKATKEKQHLTYKGILHIYMVYKLVFQQELCRSGGTHRKY